MKSKTILCIPDLHMPFENPKAMGFLSDLKKSLKPDLVIQLGDLIDSHTLARWDAEVDAPGAAEEHEIARERIEDFTGLFPQGILILGNHDIRAYKRMQSSGIPSLFMKSFKEAMGLSDKWMVGTDAKVDGIYFTHGDGFSGQQAALRAALAFRCSTVIGHVHSFAGIQYSNSPSGQIFGANAGCLIDEKAMAFNYAKAYPHKPVLGCLVITNGVPSFIPM